MKVKELIPNPILNWYRRRISKSKQPGLLKQRCKEIEKIELSQPSFFNEFNLSSGHPWEKTAKSNITTYYSCLYEIVKKERPKRILEIGTAFGLSAATMLKASDDLVLFISLDLGIYGDQYGFKKDNIAFTQEKIHTWCAAHGIPKDKVKFFKANTQPQGVGDNDEFGAEVITWNKIPELVDLLSSNKFDVIFVDGKHTDHGLLNDMRTFWPFLKNGGLMLCDDLHKWIYKKVFPWAGDTLRSFNEFIKMNANSISDYYIWNFPQVPPNNFTGRRPFGLIRKKENYFSRPIEFETFDSLDAMEINKARLDHLASLGLNLAHRKVLEVGSGVGWHTGFFEELGCEVLSTEAKINNVNETKIRYPGRRVEMADLSIAGSHDKFGKFDVVYCYGTLYHLSNPALCIKDLATVCTDLFLLETCVYPIDNDQINNVEENKNNPNQSFEGIGCRPGRDWVMAELKKYYPYVYVSVTQPDYKDFPLRWLAELPKGVENARAIFVASRKELNLPTLRPTLPMTQDKLKS